MRDALRGEIRNKLEKTKIQKGNERRLPTEIATPSAAAEWLAKTVSVSRMAISLTPRKDWSDALPEIATSALRP